MQVDVCVVRMAVGVQITDTDVMVGDEATVMAAEPDLVASCVEVAVMVAIPADAGVKTPAPLTAPILDGLTDQVTALLKLPAPDRLAVHADVCAIRMEPGAQVTDTVVIVDAMVTGTFAELDLVVYLPLLMTRRRV